MRCPMCGSDADSGHQFCAVCGAALHPAHSGPPAAPGQYPTYDVRSPYEDWPPAPASPAVPAGPPLIDPYQPGYDYGAIPHSGPPASPYSVPPAPVPPVPAPAPSGIDSTGRIVTLLVDAFVCLAILAAGLVTAVAVARTRGGSGPVVFERFGWLQLFLALVVLAVYPLGAWAIGGRTVGRALAERMAGRPGTRPPAAGALPAAVVALLAGVLVGAVTPAGVRDAGAPQPDPTAVAASANAGSTSAAPGGGTPGTGARAQAVAIDDLLNFSSGSRSSLATALADLESCRNAGSAIATLRRVTGERDTQLGRARSLSVDLLTNGTQIRAALVDALTNSVAADRAFGAWAENVAAGRCGHDANWADASDASVAATAAKRQFCQVWNPVAVSFGLPTRTEGEV